MDKDKFEKLLSLNPDRKFCLHNGYAGFAYGMPSNPKWISNERAWKILERYERLTGVDPIENFDKTWDLHTLLFDKRAWTLRITTFHKMNGFNLETECLYGKDGLG